MVKSGQQIGSYTLIKEIGRGGFGEVWLAERRTQLVTTQVAVKLPRDEQVDIEDIKKEAELWVKASGHPNVLPIIEANIYDGQVVIVSEYVSDGSLDGLLKKAKKLSINEAVEMVIGILNGLSFLHKRNIIHRDIKPANVLLQGDTPRLADFGISRAITTDSLSQTVAGTFNYMSPESFDGKRNAQTDIWAVGVILYRMLTGKLPFPQQETTELIGAIITKEPKPLPNTIPEELREIVGKALAKPVTERYKTALEMKSGLQRFLRVSSEEILIEDVKSDTDFEEKIIESDNNTQTDVQFLSTKKLPDKTNEVSSKQVLAMRSITKEFPGVKALDGVTFDLYEGEFHSLVGENGAGKSTLMKVLSGVYPIGTYDGDIVIEGEVRQFKTIRDSENAGIAIIFQELSLVKELTVGENIFLGKEPAKFGIINWSELYQKASKLLKDLHLPIDPRTPVGNLGIGQQQLVEIAKALSQEAKILVLDEPTAALTESEVETLFEILRKLKARGVGMIYISHKLDEVFEMSDRITVLRDGKTVGTNDAKDLTKDKVISLMVGREVGDIFPQISHEFGETALEVRNVSTFDLDNPNKKLVDNVSFSVKKGEVLGISGLMGAGRSELLMSIFGAWQGKSSGEILVEGRPVAINSPSEAIKNGIGFVTEDRKRYGLLLEQTIVDNMALAGLKKISGAFITHRSRETVAAKEKMQSLRVKANSPVTVAGTLSGGNQQKVVLGKWLLTNPKVLFLDEPTRGIDVGAKQEIYSEINKLAKEGLAIVMVSSELPEVLGLSDRVLVLHEGKLTGEFSKAEATPEKVMAAATATL